MFGKGQKSKWSKLIVAGRPEEIIKPNDSAINYITQYIGFIGYTPKNGTNKLYIIVDESNDTGLWANYPNVPVGTIILTPKLDNIFCFVRTNATVSGSNPEGWRKVPKIYTYQELNLTTN